MKKHFARLLLPLGVLCAAAALLFYPTQAAAGAKRGIGYCVDILIPSLFPFMALSVFVVKSGLAASMGRLTAGPCRILFGLPGSAAAAIVMSMVGGYPVGARAVAALCQEGEITPQEAARMLCFCVNSGPAFVLSVVGAGLLRNAQAGVILLASQLSASLLLGILCSLGVSRKQRGKAVSQKGMGAAQALICSASDAARSMLSMCCFVILFAVLLDFFAGISFLPHRIHFCFHSAGGDRRLQRCGAAGPPPMGPLLCHRLGRHLRAFSDSFLDLRHPDRHAPLYAVSPVSRPVGGRDRLWPLCPFSGGSAGLWQHNRAPARRPDGFRPRRCCHRRPMHPSPASMPEGQPNRNCKAIVEFLQKFCYNS